MKEGRRIAILRVLRDAGVALGSADIARGIQEFGFELSSRTVRLCLEKMAAAGLVTEGRRGRKGGRSITQRGCEEVSAARALARVGLTAVRVDTMSYRMTFDLALGSGQIVLNMSTIDQRALPRAMREMATVFASGLGMGEYMTLFHAGDHVQGFRVPSGRIGIGTVCSVTLNGILLSAGVPTTSTFGGVLELDGGTPVRFTDIIYYNGTSLDPLEVFIKSGLLRVREAVGTGSGRIGASFREVPTCALEVVRSLLGRMKRLGVGGVLMVGKPSQPLLGIPVQEGQTGLIVAGGLNPIAAIEEAGIPTENFALAQLFEFRQLHGYRALAAEMGIALR